ncbi:MAG: Gfo/Idh/MocA family oxidoreductase [Roseiflexaceae bacterium]|nr:Gfo/Idh/MocA family oxidoreductase [Roseiflexaceae bacterium]
MHIGVIGAGGMGRYQAAIIARVVGMQVVALADSAMPPAAVELAKQLGADLLQSPEALLARPDIDAVVIATPTDTHAGLAIAAAQAGKHIFCEKPLARTLAEAQAMIAEAERFGIKLAVGHVVRYFPAYASARDLVLRGEIGTPGVARATRLTAFPHRSSWYADSVRSGGVALDVMIHDFDWMRWTFGEVERVYTLGLTPGGIAGRDAAMAVLRFRSGAIGYVEGNWCHSEFRTFLEVSGSDGLIRTDNHSTITHSVDVHLSDEFNELWPDGLEEGPYEAQFREVAAWMAGGPLPRHTAQDGLEALRIALAATESLRTGQPVLLG